MGLYVQPDASIEAYALKIGFSLPQGPTWQGCSGVHTHMTNTRITDPEILEIRYPMILNKFCLRDDGSGGKGWFEQEQTNERKLIEC